MACDCCWQMKPTRMISTEVSICSDCEQAINEGSRCQHCGDIIDDDGAPGHPRNCDICESDNLIAEGDR